MTTKTDLQLQLGRPQIAGPLAVYPIFGGEATLWYRSLGQAVKHGAFISEVDDGGSVNEVLIGNASDQPVLLYEGELIKGARQNRTIDQPVLVPAGVELRIEVSCVEQGRWEHAKRADHFTPAPHAADPELRRTKRAAANHHGFAGHAPRPQQPAVWADVGARLAEHDVVSASAALSDVYDAKRPALEAITQLIRPEEGQVGTIVELSGRPVVLDLVSRSEVFADLLPRLADGYALQALHARETKPSRRAAQVYLEAVLASRRRWLSTPGMGDAFGLTGGRVDGCGLIAEGELVALSAFPTLIG